MISLIVPIYNAASYLPTCIESVFAQTESDWQLILVDDGSLDDSLSIAQAYAKKDRRVEVFAQSHAGQSQARNLGLSHAKGEYIAFVDADDYIDDDWCQRHLAEIGGVDYVQSGYMSGQQARLPRHRYQFTSPCMRLYRLQAIQEMQFTEGMIYEDIIWSTELWLRNTTCRMIDYAGYHYTVNPLSTTSRPHPQAQNKVLTMLKEKISSASIKGKIIVLYTIIRLTLHFRKQ